MLRDVLFPAESRYLPGQRWINIGLRTTHLIGVAGLGAGFLYPAADEQWRLYLHIALLSGTLLSLLFIYSNAIWLLQLRGQAILLKVGLFGLIPLLPALRLELFLAVVVLSGIFAHAPAGVRYYSPWHRRRLERLP